MEKKAVKFVYVANDGTEFASEVDCKIYEAAVNETNAAGVEIYNVNKLAIKEDILFKADIIILKDKNAYQYFKNKYEADICNYMMCYDNMDGNLYPTGAGIWVKNDLEWIQYSDFLARMEYMKTLNKTVEEVYQDNKI